MATTNANKALVTGGCFGFKVVSLSLVVKLGSLMCPTYGDVLFY